jgi:hypothetical protein
MVHIPHHKPTHAQQPAHPHILTFHLKPALNRYPKQNVTIPLIVHSISNLPTFNDQQFAQQLK